MSSAIDPVRRIEPLAGGWRSAAWRSMRFDTAGRTFTPDVEGIIRVPEHIVMVTLSGSAHHIEVNAECGHRYAGPDHAGAVSFVPAGRLRHLKMRGVASRWGSISLDPSLLAREMPEGGDSIAAFSNRDDPFIAATIGALANQIDRSGSIDPLYGEALGLALVRHLALRHGVSMPASPHVHLPRWKLARIADYIDAHIEQSLQIADLAVVAELSPGHFHRAFKATVGCTPLVFLQRRRIERAIVLLQQTDLDIASIALRIGFPGPSHFARVFRQIKGCNPSVFRRLSG